MDDHPESVSSTSRIVTVPNALSVLRLALIPVFLWLLLDVKADAWAFWVLMLSGFTDWAPSMKALIEVISSGIANAPTQPIFLVLVSDAAAIPIR